MGESSGPSQKEAENQRRRRGSGRLGRGLGALIPTVEEPPAPARPLDVLLPDLGTGAGARATSERGGSAKDLLSPRSPRNVPRETPRKEAQHARAKRAEAELVDVPGATFGLISTDWIIPNLRQPRTVFDPEEIQELAASIAEVGVLQPIVLRRITEETLSEEGQRERLERALAEQPEAKYEIVMGERRWRASQLAGLESIPAIIRSTQEDSLLRDALLENLHRSELNPLEEAAAYNQLMQDFNCTQEELSSRIARSRPQIANTLRLLNLPSRVQRQVAAGVLTAGHARALLGLPDAAAMEELATRIVAEGLSVRATEEQVRHGRPAQRRKPVLRSGPPPHAQRVADLLAEKLETTVSAAGSGKKGRLVISFAGADDLDRIAAELGLIGAETAVD